MKKLIKVMLCAAIVGLFAPGFVSESFAQQKKKDTVKLDPDKKIKKTAKKVGDKTAEIAVKGASAVSDKTHADKVGPAGQTIYIDKHAKYYYVDKKGGKVYVAKAQLKDRPKN